MNICMDFLWSKKIVIQAGLYCNCSCRIETSKEANLSIGRLLKALLGVMRFYWDSAQHARLVTACLHGRVGPVRSWEKAGVCGSSMVRAPASLYSVPPLAETASDSVDSGELVLLLLTALDYCCDNQCAAAKHTGI